MRKLLKSLKNFENKDIAITDTDELMKLARIMNLEASKLLESKQLSDREAIPLFLEKLTPRFQEKILDSLETERRGQPAPAANANANANATDEEDKTLTLKQVLNEAKWLAQQRDRDIDFFQRKNSSSRRDMSPGPSVGIKRESASRDATDMLEQIKLSVVNMMDKMESIQVQKLSEMDQNQKKKLNELEQFYKSLPGRVPGAPDSQTRPLRQEYRTRPVTNQDLCHYCQEAGGHFISDCPHCRAHITSGALKIIDGRDYTSSGIPLRIGGPRSRKQQIEDCLSSKGPGPAKVTMQNAFVQHHPAAGGYRLDVEEQMAIETDNGDGYPPEDVPVENRTPPEKIPEAVIERNSKSTNEPAARESRRATVEEVEDQGDSNPRPPELPYRRVPAVQYAKRPSDASVTATAGDPVEVVKTKDKNYAVRAPVEEFGGDIAEQVADEIFRRLEIGLPLDKLFGLSPKLLKQARAILSKRRLETYRGSRSMKK
ncbi:hypothetical protein B0H16DRAFT_1464890 [Mycena metata]|uniref:Uncharacterized protein n=1 Tax=Mycena metata TaxID=1033252 RepID=A0AAD7N0K1_9AGAR|nr:hypothetical protein B0H16DRAFT_1464890 [Mycena metata]